MVLLPFSKDEGGQNLLPPILLKLQYFRQVINANVIVLEHIFTAL